VFFFSYSGLLVELQRYDIQELKSTPY